MPWEVYSQRDTMGDFFNGVFLLPPQKFASSYHKRDQHHKFVNHNTTPWVVAYYPILWLV